MAMGSPTAGRDVVVSLDSEEFMSFRIFERLEVESGLPIKPFTSSKTELNQFYYD